MNIIVAQKLKGGIRLRRLFNLGVILVLLITSVLIGGCSGNKTSTVPPPPSFDANPLPAGWVRLYDFSTGDHSWQGIIQDKTTYGTTTVPVVWDANTTWYRAAFPSISDTNNYKICLEVPLSPIDLSAYKTLTVKVKHTGGANFNEVAFAIMEAGYMNWNGDSKASISDQINGDTFTIDLTQSVDLTNVIYIGVECKTAPGASGAAEVYITSINAEPL